MPWCGDGFVALPPLRVGDAVGVAPLFRGVEWFEDKSITCLSFEGDCVGDTGINPVAVDDAAAAAKIDEVNDSIELDTDLFRGLLSFFTGLAVC